MATVTFDHLTKAYADGTVAVDDLDLLIKDGEFLVLVGPSGCGKTTALRCLAGLEEITAGQIKIDARVVNRVPSKDRNIAMVLQSYALYPHMTVFDNLAFGLKLLKTPKKDIKRRVEEAAKILNLENLLDRKPRALSGGQRQRVALGRAIVREPAAFLMDEPLSNLDAKLRVGMRAELARLHERLGRTTVYVTHDQIEAMTLGQRVAVMRDGRVQQVDVPQVLYAAPQNLFVAAFIGSPSMNVVHATLEHDSVEFAGYRLPLARRAPARGPVILGIRPEAFEDAAFADPALPAIEVEVEVLEELGSDAHVIFRVDAPRVETEDVRAVVEEEDEALLADERTSVFNARVNPETKARVGERVRLTVDTRTFHFFDPETGESLSRTAPRT